MTFGVRFRIGNRLGATSRYSLVEVCIHLVDRYSLTETEITKIVQLPAKEAIFFMNEDMEVRRLA